MKIDPGAPIRQAVQQFGDAIALTSPAGDLTFAALGARANAFGDGLRQHGVAIGDRVGVLSHNRTEVVEAWLGCEAHGLVRVVLHSHFEFATHVQTLNHVGASTVLFDTAFTDAVAAHRTELSGVRLWVAVGGDAPDWATAYDDIVRSGSDDPPDLELDEEHHAIIQLTTGTTGLPKPWIVTHRAWRGWIKQNAWHLDTFTEGGAAVGPDDVNMHIHALQWASGAQTLYPYLLRGARTVILDDRAFDPIPVVDAIAREGVTGVLIPAPMLPSILDVIESRPDFEHRLRRVVIFFATPELLRRTSEVLGDVWCHGFGSTEQGAVTTRLRCADATTTERLGSVGRPGSPFLEVAVVDPDGRRLPAGGIGEIVVRSEMSTSTYWGLPEKTAASMLDGGWFRPEDVGYVDAEGFLHYLDRAKDQIETSEGVVYPHVVEMAILRHPAVTGCGAVGLKLAGERRVVVAVTVAAGRRHEPGLAEQIRQTAADALDRGKPAEVVVVDELPTVLGGAKVQREVLRDRLSAARV